MTTSPATQPLSTPQVIDLALGVSPLLLTLTDGTRVTGRVTPANWSPLRGYTGPYAQVLVMGHGPMRRLDLADIAAATLA